MYGVGESLMCSGWAVGVKDGNTKFLSIPFRQGEL